MNTWILLPTYNERQNLERLVRGISHLALADITICVIDDDSPDGTGELADRLAKHFPLKVLHRTGKMGLGTAYQEGFAYALSHDAEYVITMDVDLSHDPEDIPRLREACEHADVVIGSRRVEGGKIIGWSTWRRFASAGAMILARHALGLKAHDVTSGFRCYRATVLQRVLKTNIRSNGYAFLEEILYAVEKAGFRVQEIPITFVDRQEGRSKLGSQEILRFFLTIFRLRWNIFRDR